MSAQSSAAIIHDKPQGERFDDLYHLFLAKIARLPLDPALNEAEEARLIRLFTELNTARRNLEKN